jgi:HPt (histidine-containing phosphotransfer) domain-containing protein
MSQEIQDNQTSVVDYQQLLVRCLNNLAFSERMLNLFQTQCEQEIARLEEAFNTGNADSVRKIAHRLAGASANAAAIGLQRSAADLRVAASDGLMDKAAESLNRLRAEWRRFGEEMSSRQNIARSASAVSH